MQRISLNKEERQLEKFKKIKTKIDDVYIVEPTVFEDERGYFMETYSKKEFEKIGLYYDFVQDNQSKSKKGVLRGLHFQKENTHTQHKTINLDPN